MSLERYLALDVSRKSEAATDLFDGLGMEANHQVIALTPILTSGEPSFLTPTMAGWYSSVVQPLRGPALSEVTADFQSLSTADGSKGMLYESERDRLEHTKFREIAGEREAFFQNKEVSFVREEIAKKKTEYESLKAQNGREAIKRTAVFYAIVMACFMTPEFLINWDSSLKIPGFTPAYASGLVLIVAISFAFSAHSVGKIIKQRKELFGGHVGRMEKSKSRYELIFSLLLFFIGMAAVAWGRWFFIRDALLEKSILRGGGLDWTDFLQFGGAMLGNLMVWLLGVLWSVIKHDSVPGFSELREQLERLQMRQMALFETYLTRRNQQHIQNAHKQHERLNRAETAQKQNLEGYNVVRGDFAKLRQKDEQVLALFKEYRSRLISKLKSEKNPRYFLYDDVTKSDVDSHVRISPDQYGTLAIDLKYY